MGDLPAAATVLLTTRRAWLRHMGAGAVALAAHGAPMFGHAAASAGADTYDEGSKLKAATGFFGQTTEGLAQVIEKAYRDREKRQVPVQDEHRVAGTAIGAVAGGLLGSTLGGGSGETLATVAGTAIGGYTGNQVQKNMQQKDVVTTTERRCKTVNDTWQKLVGYDVTYRLDGKDGVVRMSAKPGATLPVKDGKVVTKAPAAQP